MSRILVVRLGAIGDCIIMTPLLRWLKSLGHEIYLNTSETGMTILAGCPYVDKFIPYKSDSVQNDLLGEFWNTMKKTYECDAMINLCESLEVALAVHPSEPNYNYSKKERFEICNKNYYEFSFEWARKKMPELPEPKNVSFTPELPFTEAEIKFVEDQYKSWKGKYVIVWGLSGSGRNKTYPFTDFIIGDLLKEFKRKLLFVTVGDSSCKVLEAAMEDTDVIRRAGDWTMRQSILATKYANLVVSPDTGLLHGASCFDTPKVALLGHTTAVNITKTFKNAYPIEAQCDCAPCFRLIYESPTQCPIDPFTGACWCMSHGLPMERVYEHIKKVINETMPDM